MFAPNKSLDPLKKTSKLVLILILTALVLALTGGLALAHGAIMVDGNPMDWCSFAALSGAPDVRTWISCPAGTEILWEDAAADQVTGFIPPGVDLQYYATTMDPNTIFFLIGYASIGVTEHFQIAIDVAPGAGLNVWRNPTGAPLAPMGLNAAGGIAPDYLITTDLFASTVSLWEATTNPGLWTQIGGPIPIGFSPGVVEFSIPLTSFSCPGCPAFGPGTLSFQSVLTTYDDVVCSIITPTQGSPCAFDAENDILSELAPGTFTTTPNACPSGPGSTACELLDGSADAFIRVQYQNPTAINLADFDSRPLKTSLWPVLGILIFFAATGLVYEMWRRRPRWR